MPALMCLMSRKLRYLEDLLFHVLEFEVQGDFEAEETLEGLIEGDVAFVGSSRALELINGELELVLETPFGWFLVPRHVFSCS